MNNPYWLFPIGILLLMLYLLSMMLVRINIISKVNHRKIWNSALLITFLVTGILGILLAIQTNNKLEWPLVKTLLKWHVDFGIAMSFIGMFHLLRHSKYYLKIFKPENANSTKEVLPENFQPANIHNLKILILLSGFLSTSIQVLLIREITTVFQGNELMMSWTLGAWMLLTGIGVFLGRSKINPEKTASVLDKVLILFAFLPVVLVPLLDILKTSLFLPGVMVNPAYFLLILVVFLTPICLLSGFIYSFLVNTYRSGDAGFTKVYALEATGSLIGGLVVSFVFVQWLSVIQSLLIMLLLVIILFAFIQKEIKYFVAVAIMLAAVVLSGIFQLDNRLKSFLFINQKVLDSKETYYGNITITENAGQYNFFGNGSLLYTTDNTITSEEYTHYALMQHSHPKDVLLVSGGIAGMVSEILKYKSVENVDYIELNPQLISMAAKYQPLPTDKRVHLIYDDGRRAIQHVKKKYDVVIFAVPDPSSLQINRFYTDEFLALLKQKLNPGAVILYGVSSSADYMSAGKIGIETTVFQTLKNNFQQVEIIPGERDYFIASDSALRIDIAQLSASEGIDTKYVNSYYIDDISIQQRGTLIRENLKEKILNLDEKPLPVYFHTLQFISEFTSKGWMLIAIPVIILLIPLFFMRSVAAGMYISGFTASSFEILIVFSFQTFFGYVYSAIGLIIAIFMGGLAVGSIVGNRFKAAKKQFVWAQVILGCYVLLFLVFWNIQKGMANSFTGLLLFGLITFILSAITGFQYVIGTKILPGNFIQTAPLLYAVDLIGAALGAIAITIILLPLLGIMNSCLLIAGFNFLIAIFNGIRKN
jgi:spermidine synthase